MRLTKLCGVSALLLALSMIAATVGAQTARRSRRTPRHASPAQRARARTANLPTAKKIFDDYERAVGGAGRLDRFTSSVMKGRLELAPTNARGTIEITQKAPNKMLIVMTLRGLGTFQLGFDGKKGWANDTINGLREMSGDELASTRSFAAFGRQGAIGSYAGMRVTSREKVGEREAYVVEELSPRDTSPTRMYFDAQTKLLLRMDIVATSAQGRMNLQMYFEDYRNVDGTKWPFTLRQMIGAVTMIINFTEIKHDTAIDDAVFAKPAA